MIPSCKKMVLQIKTMPAMEREEYIICTQVRSNIHKNARNAQQKMGNMQRKQLARMNWECMENKCADIFVCFSKECLR